MIANSQDKGGRDKTDGEKADAERRKKPYIAAKFLQRNIPYTFHLGSGDTYDGFENKKLAPGIKYRIFVRAVVDTPQKVNIEP